MSLSPSNREIKERIMARNTVEAWGRNMRPLSDADREAKRRRALATLRQDLWEATQWVGMAELERFCSQVIDEVRSDLP